MRTSPIVAKAVQANSDAHDSVTLKNFDGADHGCLQLILTESQLRIELHAAGDSLDLKSVADSVVIDLATEGKQPFMTPVEVQ